MSEVLTAVATSKRREDFPRDTSLTETGVEVATRHWGERLFGLIEQAAKPSILSSKGFHRAMMEWAIKDEAFKVQLFRFVDVLPTLSTSREISRHLTEYLDHNQLQLSFPIRWGVRAAGWFGGIVGGGVKAQVTRMARLFMLGHDRKLIAKELKRLHDEKTAFTLDSIRRFIPQIPIRRSSVCRQGCVLCFSARRNWVLLSILTWRRTRSRS